MFIATSDFVKKITICHSFRISILWVPEMCFTDFMIKMLASMCDEHSRSYLFKVTIITE